MKKYIQYPLLSIVILLFSSTLYGQLSNCNVFLQNNYLEVGVNWNGCFGSSTPPPAGYHPDTLSAFYNCDTVLTADTALGFVADVDSDGWHAGTPNYYGDYILPGVHQEGWSLMVDGAQINEWNGQAGDTSVLSGDLVPAGVEYLTGPTGDTSIWTATYQDYLQITQYTVVDTNQLFATVYVFLTNSGFGTAPNVYYLRTIKSNNDALLPGGSYTTRNKIAFTSPDSLSRSVVTSVSTLYPKAYIALASRNPSATCFIMKNSSEPLLSSTIDNISAGLDTNYLYGQNDSAINQGGIGIVFDLGNIPPTVADDTFSFVYAFTPGALLQALGLPAADTTDTSSLSAATNHLIPTSYAIYPNPVNSHFSVRGMINTDHLVVYDELGRNVSQNIIKTGHNTFNTNDLQKGLYMLLLSDSNGNVKWKTPLQKL